MIRENNSADKNHLFTVFPRVLSFRSCPVHKVYKDPADVAAFGRRRDPLFNVVFLAVVVFFGHGADFFRRGQDVGQGNGGVHEVADGGRELAHLGFYVIGAGQEFRDLVGQVGGDDPVEPALFVGRVEGFHAVREEAEGCADEHPLRAHLLQLPGGIQHAAAGRDHVVDDDDIPALDIVPQEFVRHDGILAVDDDGVVPALV